MMRISVPAKINLHLRVGPPRADGFHPLMTWMTTIGLFDEITFTEPDRPGEISMTCSNPVLPCDDRNLVIKAAKLLRQHPARGVAIHLEKQIPHGGGLGGGSSDAAFSLSALNEFWELKKSTSELSDLAARLGSDISFFLFGPSSVCRGRGEIVTRVPSPVKAKWVLLILPELSMPTPAVYRQFDAMKCGHDLEAEIEPVWNQWAALSSQELLPKLVNDLEIPSFAIEPKLARLRESIEKAVNRPVRMSGSGSSLFTLYDDRAEAEQATELVAHRCDVKALAVELSPPSKTM